MLSEGVILQPTVLPDAAEFYLFTALFRSSIGSKVPGVSFITLLLNVNNFSRPLLLMFVIL